MASTSVIKTGEVKPGQGFPKKAIAVVNNIIADLRAIEPKEGRNVTFRRFKEGTEINAGQGSGAAGDLGGLTYPSVDGTYVLGVVVTSGVPVLQWLATDTCA